MDKRRLRFPDAKVVANQGQRVLIDLLKIPENQFLTMQDGETLSLGDKTLKFIQTPWVHWPETMVTYLEEDRNPRSFRERPVIPNLNVEVLGPVLCKGVPSEAVFESGPAGRDDCTIA